jgi:sugar transferase (PEP-CTERM/EpsH1 system associated)
VRILFLTHRLPYAPNRGDRVRAYHLLHEMSKWAEVDLVSLVHDPDEAAHIRDLRDVTTSMTTARVPRLLNALRAGVALPTSKPTTHSMLQAPGLARAIGELVQGRKPDLVFAYCTGVAPLALLPSLGGVPLVLDMVDVDSAKWTALSKTSLPPLSWIYRREARCLSAFERDICGRAVSTWVVTARERDTLASIAPGATIEVVPNGVDAGHLKRPEPSEAPNPAVVFCGVMNYGPNVDGVAWLVRHVWPLVRKQLPAARFQIVGSHPDRTVRALADPMLGVEVTGEVPDVRPYLWGGAVGVAPLLVARGVQNKVLEAVAAGLPAVVTPVVSDGLPDEVKSAVQSAIDPADFAAALVQLLQLTAPERRAIAARANLEGLSWPHRLARVRNLLTTAASTVKQ